MKAVFKEAFAGNSSTDAAELLLAELRERRKHLQQLIRLVNEEAVRHLQAKDAPRAPKSLPRYKCRRVSASAAIATRGAAGAA